MRPIRSWATAVVAGTLFLIVAGTASAATVYSNIPSPLAGNYPSEAFEARSISEFGGLVGLAPGARNNPVVTVTMSSWGCQSGGGTTCATTPGAVFSLPIALNIYAVNTDNSVGDLLATDTQTFKIPYRPSDNEDVCPADSGGTRWGTGGTSCYHGLAHNISWDLGGRSVTLPDKVIVTVMYNTSHHGYQPIGEGAFCYSTGCGYDSLNVALMSGVPSVGSDPLSDAAYLSSTWNGAYGDGGAGGLGVFRYDPSGWTPYQPAIQIDTYPLQTGPTGPAGATGSTGATGPTGAAGPAGPAGADGSSCTVTDNHDGTKTISCDDGTSVTVSDGAPGATGATGPAGGTGLAGPTGATGLPGPAGPTGPAGPAGLTGTTGPAGPAGPIGLTGPAGADGTNAVATPAVAVSRPNTKLIRAKIRAATHAVTFNFKGVGGKGKLGFQCRLDAKKFTTCRSGKTYKNLKAGKHVFQVRAKDASGKLDLTPVTKKFVI